MKDLLSNAVLLLPDGRGGGSGVVHQPVQKILKAAVESGKGLGDERIDEYVRYYFYPTWRSQLFPLIGYFILSYFAIWLSHKVDVLVISGKLFDLGDTIYMLDLPAVMLGKILIYIYDSKYIIDERGVEAQIGLVSLHLRQPRLRWEDI